TITTASASGRKADGTSAIGIGASSAAGSTRRSPRRATLRRASSGASETSSLARPRTRGRRTTSSGGRGICLGRRRGSAEAAAAPDPLAHDRDAVRPDENAGGADASPPAPGERSGAVVDADERVRAGEEPGRVRVPQPDVQGHERAVPEVELGAGRRARCRALILRRGEDERAVDGVAGPPARAG